MFSTVLVANQSATAAKKTLTWAKISNIAWAIMTAHKIIVVGDTTTQVNQDMS
jgi:hypothetical protein